MQNNFQSPSFLAFRFQTFLKIISHTLKFNQKLKNIFQAPTKKASTV